MGLYCWESKTILQEVSKETDTILMKRTNLSELRLNKIPSFRMNPQQSSLESVENFLKI